MVGSSILPVTIHKKRLYFLFGKENSLADTPGWSDFGGGVEAGESVHATAMREGGEELTGFLGDGKEIADHIQKHGGTYNLNYNDQYHIHMFYMPYDETLPGQNPSDSASPCQKEAVIELKILSKAKAKPCQGRLLYPLGSFTRTGFAKTDAANGCPGTTLLPVVRTLRQVFLENRL